jgi:hypothetical protein
VFEKSSPELISESVFKNALRSRPDVIPKEAPHGTICSHEILRAD